jgi:hypothetical protein
VFNVRQYRLEYTEEADNGLLIHRVLVEATGETTLDELCERLTSFLQATGFSYVVALEPKRAGEED